MRTPQLNISHPHFLSPSLSFVLSAQFVYAYCLMSSLHRFLVRDIELSYLTVPTSRFPSNFALTRCQYGCRHQMVKRQRQEKPKVYEDYDDIAVDCDGNVIDISCRPSSSALKPPGLYTDSDTKATDTTANGVA